MSVTRWGGRIGAMVTRNYHRVKKECECMMVSSRECECVMVRVWVCSGVRVWVCDGESIIFSTHGRPVYLSTNMAHTHSTDQEGSLLTWVDSTAVGIIALDNSDTPSTNSQVDPSTTESESTRVKGQPVGESLNVTLQKREGSKKAKKSGDKAEQ